MRVFGVAALLAAIFQLVLRSRAIRGFLAARWPVLRSGYTVACSALALLAVLCGLVTVRTERIRFYEETTILSIAAAFHHGQPLYPAHDAPVEYALLYGPVTYLVYLAPMLAGAERLRGYEAWALGALALTLLVSFLALRPRFGRLVALGSVAFLAAIVARVTDNEWAIKADVWILLFSALGLFAAMRLRPWAAACVIALCGAMLLDLKITLLLIGCLPCVLLGQRAKRQAILGGLLMVPLAALPFALARVSLRNYVSLIVAYSGRSTSIPMLRLNAAMTLLILLPGFTLFWAAWHRDRAAVRLWRRERAPYLGLLAAAVVIATTTGAKIGGGPWHCVVLTIPSLIICAELWMLAARTGSRSLVLDPAWSSPMLGVGCALFLTAFPALATGVRARLHDSPGSVQVSMRDAESDLLNLMDRYPGSSVQMGYTDDAHYNLTFVRPVLQIRGNPLFIDGNARNEADLAGEPVSPAVLDALATCRIQFWILPHGDPFSLASPYYLAPGADRTRIGRELYPPAVRQTFLAHYRPVAQPSLGQPSRYFDVWACRSPGQPLAEPPAR